MTSLKVNYVQFCSRLVTVTFGVNYNICKLYGYIINFDKKLFCYLSLTAEIKLNHIVCF